ncbi:hypothetical protein FNH22_13230 [Fulvivirga sp. M361]|uniref:hypothetical protein n=1 Tax=Fulvivirga sp. M361 TaxID=2594266 RepID=UPI00117B5D99|nr:hypothetical protein [Fulvivirga sp. M361]TRX58831.1 hypothetical protein FNH22_13230 [Fulvivirga sp. M361]
MICDALLASLRERFPSAWFNLCEAYRQWFNYVIRLEARPSVTSCTGRRAAEFDQVDFYDTLSMYMTSGMHVKWERSLVESYKPQAKVFNTVLAMLFYSTENVFKIN